MMKPETAKPLTIGQLAGRAGVGVETVRFYERKGLLKQPDRRDSGYRMFDDAAVRRLRFIRRAKELGFTLQEIKDLLDVRVDATATCAEVKDRAEAKIADIADKIKTLEQMKKALVKLTRTCRGVGPTSDCPILDAMDGE